MTVNVKGDVVSDAPLTPRSRKDSVNMYGEGEVKEKDEVVKINSPSKK